MCASTVPPGWSLAIFNAGLDPCPTGFTEHVVLGAPSIGAGACTCTCSVTAPGACDQASLSILGAPGHGVDTCSTSWFSPTVSGPGCVAVPAASQAAFDSYQATASAGPGAGGTCAAQLQPNPALLSEPSQRFCDVPSSSADAVCGGTAPAGFSACIVAPGVVPCPAATPFVNATTVESGATLSCGSCSACAVATTCSNPTVAAFTNATCTAPAAFSFPADGTCVASAAGEVTFLSIEYSATATASCTPGTSTPSVQLTGAQTVCCR